MMRKWCMLFMLAAALALPASDLWAAEILVNGDFEDLTEPFPNGWFSRGTNPALPHAGLAGTTTGCWLVDKSSGDDIGQRFDPVADWTLEFLFATEDPGAGSARCTNIGIRHGSVLEPFAFDGQINLRVVDSDDNGVGDIEILDFDLAPVWQPVLTNVVDFSIDGNADESFDDPEDTLNVNTLKIVANYSAATPSYAVTLTDAGETPHSASGLQLWQGSPPSSGQGMDWMAFDVGNTTVNSLIDEVSLTAGGTVPLLGDLNDDGFVGGADLDIVRSFWGQTVTAGNKLKGDPSGDGFVGGDDLDEVRAHWGEGTPPAGPIAVPEPGILILVCGALGVGLLWRHR